MLSAVDLRERTKPACIHHRCGHRLEALEPRVLLAIDLQAALGDGLSLPAVIVPGDKVNVPLVVSNEGDEKINARIAADLYVSTDPVLDNQDTLVARLTNRSVRLQPLQETTLPLTWQVSSVIEPGEYFLLAQIDPENTITESDELNNVASTGQAQPLDWVFGTVQGRKKRTKLVLNDEDGTAVTFTLAGNGSGQVTVDEITGQNMLLLRDTDAKSTVKMTTKGGGDGRFVIEGIAALDPVGRVIGKTVDLHGNALLAGGIGWLELGDVTASPVIQIGSSPALPAGVTIRLGLTQDLSIDSMTPIRSLTLTESADTDFFVDTITAPSIGKLTTQGDKKRNLAGDFNASVILTGAGGDPVTLGAVKIAGSVGGSSWVVSGGGQTAKIQVNGGVTGWSLNTSGPLKSLKLGDVASAQISVQGPVDTIDATRWAQGSISAHAVKVIKIRGSRADDIAADFGADVAVTGTDDPAVQHGLGSAKINGDVHDATWEINGDTGRIAVGGQADLWVINIAGALGAMKLRGVISTDLTASGVVGSIDATQWLEGQITAHALRSLKIKGDRRADLPGDFHADLTLLGTEDPKVKQTLASAKISGVIDSSVWQISGQTGRIEVKQGVHFWSVTIEEDLGSLNVADADLVDVSVGGQIGKIEATRWTGGSIEAQSIRSIKIKGDRKQNVPGDLDVDLTLSGASDPAVKQTLGNVTITGNVENTAWEVAGEIKNLRVDGVIDNWILDMVTEIGALRLGDVQQAEISVSGKIGRTQATRWTGGLLSAATIGTLTIKGDKATAGDFGAELLLTGDLLEDLALGNARVVGAWTGQAQVTGDVKALTINRLSGQIMVDGDVKKIALDDLVGFVDPGGSEVGTLHISGSAQVKSKGGKIDTAGSTLFTSPSTPL